MDKFKEGDKVRYVGHPHAKDVSHVAYLEGHVGTIVSGDTDEDYKVMWDAPYPELDWDRSGGKEVTWAQFFGKNRPEIFELVEELHKPTVDAILEHLRSKGLTLVPAQVEKAYAELTAPKTHTVVVEFEVDQTFDLVAVLTDVETLNEGIRSVDVKED